MNKQPFIRRFYLYLFTAVGLVMTLMGCVGFVNLALRIFIFTGSDQYVEYAVPVPPPGMVATATDLIAQRQKQEEYYRLDTRRRHQSDAAGSLALLLVGVPLYLYHWSVINREKENDAQS